jgi:hypothetical protein
MFLVGHELTHILHGHIDYLSSKRGENVTAELELSSERDAEERLERQCMEVDADRRSIFSRIDSLRVTLASIEAHTASWRSNGKDPGLMIFDWAISLNILFRLFGDLRFSQVDSSRSAYPPRLLRQAMCYGSALEAVDRTWDTRLKEAAKKALSMARYETEIAFANTLGEEFNFDLVNQEISIENRDLGKRIVGYLAGDLAARLDPFSYERAS